MVKHVVFGEEPQLDRVVDRAVRGQLPHVARQEPPSSLFDQHVSGRGQSVEQVELHRSGSIRSRRRLVHVADLVLVLVVHVVGPSDVSPVVAHFGRVLSSPRTRQRCRSEQLVVATRARLLVVGHRGQRASDRGELAVAPLPFQLSQHRVQSVDGRVRVVARVLGQVGLCGDGARRCLVSGRVHGSRERARSAHQSNRT